MKVIKSLRAPVLVTLVLLLICGLIYPVVMTLTRPLPMKRRGA